MIKQSSLAGSCIGGRRRDSKGYMPCGDALAGLSLLTT